jgi:hypothetical protein
VENWKIGGSLEHRLKSFFFYDMPGDAVVCIQRQFTEDPSEVDERQIGGSFSSGNAPWDARIPR